MAVRTNKQIQKELAQSDKPYINELRRQMKQIPREQRGIIKGLKAQQQRAFGDILSGAKGRGLKFSGIPLEEQAQFTASEFLPALAGVRSQGMQQRAGLRTSIAEAIRERGLSAQAIRQQELSRAEAARQAAADRAAYSFKNGGDSTTDTAPVGEFIAQKRKDGRFAFKDDLGQPISAATFTLQAQQQNPNFSFRTQLQQMANSGDRGAAQALAFVGDDFRPDISVIQRAYMANPQDAQSLVDTYNSLIWDTGLPQLDLRSVLNANRPQTAQDYGFRDTYSQNWSNF